MTGCAEWMDALTDCALGDVAEPALVAHLAVCAGCAAALRESRAAAARMQEALDRRAAVEPPPYGPERVMARLGERKPAGTRAWWRWAVGSMAVVLIAIVIWLRQPTREPTREPDVTALLAWGSPTRGLLQPPVGAAWNTTPQLGEGFFKINLSGETHAQ